MLPVAVIELSEPQQNGVNDFADDGGPSFGLFGGDYSRTVGGTCAEVGPPDRLFRPLHLQAL